MSEVMSFDPGRKLNWQLMIDVAQLGYLDGPGPTIDVTHNIGRFWSEGAAGLQPPPGCRFDIDPAFVETHQTKVADFRNLPLPDACVGSLVIDPPFKLNGSTSGRGPSRLDVGYDVEEYRSPSQIMDLIRAGIDEAGRVVVRGGFCLMKCMLQINASRVHDQPGDAARYAVDSGRWRHIGSMHVASGTRPQPRKQKTPRNNYSTLVCLQRTRRA